MRQINQKQMLQWLQEADDVEAVESPSNFDYLTAIQEVEAIKPKIEIIIGHELQIDRGVQDASFFTEMSWTQPSNQSSIWQTVFAVRFSAFGKLTTIWSVCPEQLKVSTETADSVVEELLTSGFRYVDVALLNELYSGLHPLFKGTNWYYRFFDYN